MYLPVFARKRLNAETAAAFDETVALAPPCVESCFGAAGGVPAAAAAGAFDAAAVHARHSQGE